MGRVARAVVSLLLLCSAALPFEPAGAASPPPTDADNATSDPGNQYGWFEAGLTWRGDFGDPQVVVANGQYYAFASPVGGRYLPMLQSTDLQNWYIHPRWTNQPAPWAGGPDPSSDPQIPAEIRNAPLSAGDKWNLNDALVAPPSWAQPDEQGPWIKMDYWAPSIIQIGSSWFAYSAVRVSWTSDDPHGYGRFCLTVASAPAIGGPYRDISGAGPILCDDIATDPGGSIDPFPFFDDRTGGYYLLWKAAGKRTDANPHPSALKAIPLGGDGRPVPGSAPVTLLETNEGSWEGSTIENPSMTSWLGTDYLFYSGNDSAANVDGSSSYASGYAVCPDGPRGGCQRATPGPLIASAGDVQGPGGSSGFVSTDGALRMAYASYWLGERRVGEAVEHPRRLGIVQLLLHPDNTLFVGSLPKLTPRSIDAGCPSSIPHASYSDTGGLPESTSRAIDCITYWGITSGNAGGNTYSPTATVTRGQMASFIARLIDASDAQLPMNAPDAFIDDNGDTHEKNIDRLANVGIVSGVGGGNYAPNESVTRGQMSTFLARAVKYVLGSALAAGPDVFADDTGSVHEANANADAAAGLAAGIAPGVFGGSRSTTRAQMAVFLSRTLDLLVTAGHATVPNH